MAKVLLIDVDSKIPNLALMKLSTFHKAKGDELQRLKFNGYPTPKPPVQINNDLFDKTYASCVFKVNSNKFGFTSPGKAQVGGTGINAINLPESIDSLDEDYSLYPGNRFSFGFITRGCPRKCGFCVVPEKEGGLYRYRSLDQIIKHSKVFFLDNNILAYDRHEEILEDLALRGISCQFNQGLDLRLITDRNAELLSKLNYFKEFTFAFDHIDLEKQLDKKIAIFKRHVPKDWAVRMFILGAYDSTIDEDLYRINWCRDNKIAPYYMRHAKAWESPDQNLYTSIAGWTNQIALFKKMSFAEYMRKRTPSDTRFNDDVERFNHFNNLAEELKSVRH